MEPINNEVNQEEYSPTRKTIMDDIMFELGYPVISLFITKAQINQMIDFAVRKCAPKACPRFLVTLYSNGLVDVSPYDMEAVSNVWKADVSGSGSSGGGCDCGCGTCGSSPSSDLGCNICDKLCQYRGFGYSNNGPMGSDWNNEMYNLIALQNTRAQMDSMLLSDWYLDNGAQKLYLDNFNGMITIEYTKSNIKIEDLAHDTAWLSWVRDYTLALCKIIEGRIRGKFKVQSAPFEIEADELVSEGNNDKQELEQKLDEDIGYYTIM